MEVWQHRIAVNAARSYRRRSLWRHLPLLSERLPARPQLLDKTFVVMRALREMSIDDATALLLRYYRGYPGEKIASGLGIPASTARGRILRARTRLRRLWSDDQAGTSKSQFPELRRESLPLVPRMVVAPRPPRKIAASAGASQRAPARRRGGWVSGSRPAWLPGRAAGCG